MVLTDSRRVGSTQVLHMCASRMHLAPHFRFYSMAGGLMIWLKTDGDGFVYPETS
jgi:hypothetical protein